MRGINFHDDLGWANISRFGSMGGGGGGGTTTVTQNQAPWAPQQPYLQGGFQAASGLYSNPQNWPSYFPSATYVPFTPGQQASIGQIQQFGQSGGGPAVNAATNTLTNVLGGGGPSNAALNQIMSGGGLPNQTLSNMMTGAGPGGAALSGMAAGTNQAGSTLGNIMARGGTPGSPTYGQAQNYLSGMIAGNTLNPWSSPGFQNVVNNTLANVIPQTTAGFVGGGRSDSGLASQAATQGATNAIGNLAFQQYNTQQQLQQQAAQQALATGLAQQQAAAGAAGTQGQLINQAALGQGQLTNQAALGQGGLISNAALGGGQLLNQAAQMAPWLSQSNLQAMQAGLGAGGLQQQDAQNILSSLITPWNYQQTLPQNMLQDYMQNISGTFGGTGTTQQPYYSNTLGNVLGSGIGAAGLANLIGGPGTVSGALSGLGGLLGIGGGGAALGTLGAGSIAGGGADLIASLAPLIAF